MEGKVISDKELNKAICKEMQAAAVSFLGSCKFELYKQKGHFLTGELTKVCDEKPWELGSNLDLDEGVTVYVGEFKCAFCIRYIFKMLGKFEKLSGTKETVFRIIEEINDTGSSLCVAVGELPSNVEKIKVTRYAKNGIDIVNRNLVLTKISDVAYAGNEDCSGRFDTYLKTDGGVYFVGVYSMEYAKAITIIQTSSAYASRIESFGDFSLIDLNIIGDVMPDRLNEAKELRDEWIKKKEAFDEETERLKIEEKKEAIKATRMDKANNTRLKNRLDKLVRYNGGVLTVKEYLHALKDTGYTPEVSEKSSVKYNRIKYNRMGYAEQQEYDRKLEKKIPMYIAINRDKVFNELSKLEFDYFSSLFKECNISELDTHEPEEEMKVAQLEITEVQDLPEKIRESDPIPVRNIVCIECEPEDVQRYWDCLDNVHGIETDEPDSAYIDVSTIQAPELVLSIEPVGGLAVLSPERLPTVFAVERHPISHTTERPRMIPLASPRFLVTNKGMYYLIA